jgi:hypothetical protein
MAVQWSWNAVEWSWNTVEWSWNAVEGCCMLLNDAEMLWNDVGMLWNDVGMRQNDVGNWNTMRCTWCEKEVDMLFTDVWMRFNDVGMLLTDVGMVFNDIELPLHAPSSWWDVVDCLQSWLGSDVPGTGCHPVAEWIHPRPPPHETDEQSIESGIFISRESTIRYLDSGSLIETGQRELECWLVG